MLYGVCVWFVVVFEFVFFLGEKMGREGFVVEVILGVFVSKIKIIIVGVIFFVLLILVIIFGVLLGYVCGKLLGILFFCYFVDVLVIV